MKEKAKRSRNILAVLSTAQTTTYDYVLFKDGEKIDLSAHMHYRCLDGEEPTIYWQLTKIKDGAVLTRDSSLNDITEASEIIAEKSPATAENAHEEFGIWALCEIARIYGIYDVAVKEKPAKA